ncbi:lethal(2) giant larvae protein homolog 1-like isoform X2 [Tachypleus tridentatus]|uniref:lethal(2) giant larvae protein homolog 1-like isoform X2 n=1 Tax=Tachypleus tridentatus TaxID=6853 RepID=UPI003FD46205
MLKFIRGKGHHVSAERQKLQKELFSYNKLIPHGFTHRPSAFAWDPKLNLIAIGTRSGFIRIYGFPGVEFYGQHEEGCSVTKLFFIPNQGRLISLCDDNSLHLWEINTNNGESYLAEVKSCSLEGRLKKISSCCLQPSGEHLLIGTEGGNIYLLDVKAFEMTDHIIYQDVIMQNVPDDYKVNPGAVEAIAEHPSNPDHVLIGYNRGLMVLWDKKNQTADKTYIGSQQLESVSWYRDGKRFMSSHNDGSYIVWSTADASKPAENPKTPYGPFPCKSMNKVLWHSVKGGEDFIIFSGGMPRASYGDRHTVTVMKGENHQVLDFTSKVIDFVAITDNSSDAEFDNPGSLLVLVEEELIAVDLETEGWPAFRQPYLASLHSSAITCTQHCSQVPQDLWDKIVAAGNKQIENHYSSNDWPITGGKNLAESPTVRELILTGHEDGTIRFWDASGVCLKHMYTLSTSSLFEGEEHEHSPTEEGEEWPPFRKVGNFDPYSDDPRLAVKKIILCALSGILVVAGTAGQIIVLEIKEEVTEKEIEVSQVNIVGDRDNFIWKGHDQLNIKNGEQILQPGFQHIVVVQLSPPAGVTALTLHSEWGLLAAGTAHGFELYDYIQKKHVMSKCSLNPNDLAVGDTAMSRRKSFKKSLRESFRRLRKGRSQRGKKDKTPTRSSSESPKEASPTDVEAQASEGQTKSVERQVEARASDDSLGSMVRCLYLAKSFIVNNVTTTPTLWAGTNAGAIYVFTIVLPDGEKRSSDSVACQLGKEIQLKHRAPVLFIHIVDQHGYPLPDPFEVQKHLANPPDLAGTHRVLICSEEQFKVFTLPTLKPYGKLKLTAHEGSRVRKVGIAKFTSKSDENYSEYCMTCLTNQGDLSIYSIPELRRQLVQSCIKKEDINGISSLVFTKNGQGFFLHSPCEFVRFTLSTTSVTDVHCVLDLPEGVRSAVEPTSAPGTQTSPEEKTSPESEGDIQNEMSTEDRKNDISESGPDIGGGDGGKDMIEGNVEEKHENRNDDSALNDEDRKDLDITVDSVRDHLANLTVEDNTFVSVEITECSKNLKTRETTTTVINEKIVNSTGQGPEVEPARHGEGDLPHDFPVPALKSSTPLQLSNRAPLAHIDELNHVDDER